MMSPTKCMIAICSQCDWHSRFQLIRLLKGPLSYPPVVAGWLSKRLTLLEESGLDRSLWAEGSCLLQMVLVKPSSISIIVQSWNDMHAEASLRDLLVRLFPGSAGPGLVVLCAATDLSGGLLNSTLAQRK
jgi:hypothetical protein